MRNLWTAVRAVCICWWWNVLIWCTLYTFTLLVTTLNFLLPLFNFPTTINDVNSVKYIDKLFSLLFESLHCCRSNAFTLNEIFWHLRNDPKRNYRNFSRKLFDCRLPFLKRKMFKWIICENRVYTRRKDEDSNPNNGSEKENKWNFIRQWKLRKYQKCKRMNWVAEQPSNVACDATCQELDDWIQWMKLFTIKANQCNK